MLGRRFIVQICALAASTAVQTAAICAEPPIKRLSAHLDQDVVCDQTAEIDAAYFANDIAAIGRYPATLEGLYNAGRLRRDWADYLSGFAHYRLALLVQDRKIAGFHAKKAIGQLEALADRVGEASSHPSLPPEEVYALLSGAYGARIATNFLAAIRLGPKSSAAIERANAAAPSNPRALLLDGVRLFNTPERFGGDISLSIIRLENALTAFQDLNAPPCWGETDAHYWLARIHAANRDASAAKRHLSILQGLYLSSPIVDTLSDEVVDAARQ